jgi:P-type E1-E2 ATPase
MGSASFLLRQGFILPEAGQDAIESEDEALHTVCWIAQDEKIVAKIWLGDAIRPDALAAVTGLLPTPSVLLSGDSAAAVAAVVRQVPFAAYQAECSPLSKREYIRGQRQRGAIVAMVGDGINDAPALTAAHIGVSVLSATDISIQVSDIMLTTDDLSLLSTAGQLARYSRRIAHQNLFWTFFYNVTGLALACLGYLTPLYSAFAMMASSTIVVTNAQRIACWHMRGKKQRKND